MRKMLLLVASLLGVAAFSARAAETVVVAMKGPGSGNPFWAAVQAGAEAKGKALGVNVVVVAPPQESDVQGQIALIEDQLAKKVSAIAIAPTDPNALAPVLEQAKKQAAATGQAQQVVSMDKNGNTTTTTVQPPAPGQTAQAVTTTVMPATPGQPATAPRPAPRWRLATTSPPPPSPIT